jgi:hypothetical protein
MTATPVLGGVRGYRWWRFESNPYGADPALLSPYRQRIRWNAEANEARCLGRKRIIGWTETTLEHPAGAPEAACGCGFYALSAISRGPEGEDMVSDIDVEISGRSGLVLGVMEGFGRVTPRHGRSASAVRSRARAVRVEPVLAGPSTAPVCGRGIRGSDLSKALRPHGGMGSRGVGLATGRSGASVTVPGRLSVRT